MSTSTFLIIGVILILVGWIAFIAAIIAFLRRHSDTSRWTSVQGIVVDVATHSVTPGNPYYFPLIEFTTLEGQTIRIEADLGSYPFRLRRGQSIPVLYAHSEPQHARIDSATARLFVPGVLAGFGFISIVLGCLFVYLSQ